METSCCVIGSALGFAGVIVGAVVAWLRLRATHNARFETAVKEALKGLLWRPQWPRQDFKKLAQHFPGITEKKLRFLLLGVGAAEYPSNTPGKKYWGFPAAQKNAPQLGLPRGP
jgi:hypothetical protein